MILENWEEKNFDVLKYSLHRIPRIKAMWRELDWLRFTHLHRFKKHNNKENEARILKVEKNNSNH